MLGVTQLGSTTVFAAVLLIVGGVLAFARRWIDVIMLVAQLSVAFVLYKGSKLLFDRPRPEIEHLVEATGSSFPSGNALMAAAFYGFAGLLLARLANQKKGMSALILVVTFAVIIMAGFSRVYMGVHYMTDIIAGYAAGGALLCIAVMLWHRISRSNK